MMFKWQWTSQSSREPLPIIMGGTIMATHIPKKFVAYMECKRTIWFFNPNVRRIDRTHSRLKQVGCFLHREGRRSLKQSRHRYRSEKLHPSTVLTNPNCCRQELHYLMYWRYPAIHQPRNRSLSWESLLQALLSIGSMRVYSARVECV